MDATDTIATQIPTTPATINTIPIAVATTVCPASTQAASSAGGSIGGQPTTTTTTAGACANVVTIPVPIVQNEEYYTYITVKGSLHDRSCATFGLNETEVQALTKRFENGVKPVVNGVMVNVPPMILVNTLAQLGYKVICSCGEAEICWTMQREI